MFRIKIKKIVQYFNLDNLKSGHHGAYVKHFEYVPTDEDYLNFPNFYTIPVDFIENIEYENNEETGLRTFAHSDYGNIVEIGEGANYTSCFQNLYFYEASTRDYPHAVDEEGNECVVRNWTWFGDTGNFQPQIRIYLADNTYIETAYRGNVAYSYTNVTTQTTSANSTMVHKFENGHPIFYRGVSSLIFWDSRLCSFPNTILMNWNLIVDGELIGTIPINICGAPFFGSRIQPVYYDWQNCYKLPILQPKAKAPYKKQTYTRSAHPFCFTEYFETKEDIIELLDNASIGDTKLVMPFDLSYEVINNKYLGYEILQDIQGRLCYYSHVNDIFDENTGTWLEQQDSVPYENWKRAIYNWKNLNPNFTPYRYYSVIGDSSYNVLDERKINGLKRLFSEIEIINNDEFDTSGATTSNNGSNGTTSGEASIGGNGTFIVNGDSIQMDTLPTTDSLDTGFITAYNVTQGALQEISNFLWSSNFLDNIPKLFNDPIDSIISLQQTYSGVSGSATNVKIGTLDTGVSGLKLDSQYVQLDLGMIDVSEVYGNFIDYAATCEIYLPFIGYQKLDTSIIINSLINIKYNVDVLTGNCIAYLEIQKKQPAENQLESLVYQFNGNMNVQLPVTGKNYAELYKTIFSTALAVGGMKNG